MANSKKNYITREWYEKLVAELRELKEVKLPDILEKLAEAKAQWDLSENFEYKSAMEDKDFVNSKIADLENLIANAEIISDEKAASKWWEVDYGTTVTLSIEGEWLYHKKTTWIVNRINEKCTRRHYPTKNYRTYTKHRTNEGYFAECSCKQIYGI